MQRNGKAMFKKRKALIFPVAWFGALPYRYDVFDVLLLWHMPEKVHTG